MIKDPKKYNILIVEDNPGDYVLIEDYLHELMMKPELIHVSNFSEVKKLTSEEKPRVDVVLLDLTLPDKHGENLITEMLALCGDAPVIVLTGYSDFSFSIKSLNLGAADYLLKDELSASTLYKSIVYTIERKRFLIDLEASEKKYRDLFHLSPTPMWFYDIVTLRFLDVNQAAVQHYGYSREEFLSMTIKDIRPPADVAKLEAVLSDRSVKITYQNIFRHTKKNGEIIHVDIYGAAVEFGDTHARVIAANDITDRINYISAIEKQNEKLREIAWQQSHIARAPLARLMALTALLREEFVSDEDGKMVLQGVLNSAFELDDIIKDIAAKSAAINIERPENEV
ncbi:MAG: PAS domain S-box protein [Ignavibacteriales bacterium]|nr:MAG: PAS domain S-box protein [Ignavibacteriales bacterium]